MAEDTCQAPLFTKHGQKPTIRRLILASYERFHHCTPTTCATYLYALPRVEVDWSDNASRQHRVTAVPGGFQTACGQGLAHPALGEVRQVDGVMHPPCPVVIPQVMIGVRPLDADSQPGTAHGRPPFLPWRGSSRRMAAISWQHGLQESERIRMPASVAGWNSMAGFSTRHRAHR